MTRNPIEESTSWIISEKTKEKPKREKRENIFIHSLYSENVHINKVV